MAAACTTPTMMVDVDSLSDPDAYPKIVPKCEDFYYLQIFFHYLFGEQHNFLYQ